MVRETIEGALEEIGNRQSVFGPKFVGLMRSVGGTLAAGATLSAAGVGLAYMEAHYPLVRHFDVPVPARPGLKETRILHISDLHMFNRQQFLVDFLKRVSEEEDYDFVVSTGDNLGGVDGYPLLMNALEPLLRTPGAFVLGSHDYYSPTWKRWSSYLEANHHEEAAKNLRDNPDLPWVETVRVMTNAGWLDLTNQSATLEIVPEGESEETTIALVGVDDPHIKRDRMPALEQSWMNPGALRLALTHSPYRRVLNTFTDSGADLILAGHTHGGQIRLPGYGALVNNCDIPRRFSRGLSLWESGEQDSWLHVSAGLGTSRTAPVRLFCRPEVSILRVCPVG